MSGNIVGITFKAGVLNGKSSASQKKRATAETDVKTLGAKAGEKLPEDTKVGASTARNALHKSPTDGTDHYTVKMTSPKVAGEFTAHVYSGGSGKAWVPDGKGGTTEVVV